MFVCIGCIYGKVVFCTAYTFVDSKKGQRVDFYRFLWLFCTRRVFFYVDGSKVLPPCLQGKRPICINVEVMLQQGHPLIEHFCFAITKSPFLVFFPFGFGFPPIIQSVTPCSSSLCLRAHVHFTLWHFNNCFKITTNFSTMPHKVWAKNVICGT